MMTPATWLLLFTVFVWAVFFVARRRFLDAMIDARLLEVRHAAYRIEQLASAGKISRDSAFYRYFRAVGVTLGDVSPRALPGFAVLAAFRLYQVESPDSEELRHLSRTALAEAEDRYREHRPIIDRMMFNLIDAWRYRSLPLWGATQFVRIIGATYDAYEIANTVFAVARGSTGRPVAAAG